MFNRGATTASNDGRSRVRDADLVEATEPQKARAPEDTGSPFTTRAQNGPRSCTG